MKNPSNLLRWEDSTPGAFPELGRGLDRELIRLVHLLFEAG